MKKIFFLALVWSMIYLPSPVSAQSEEEGLEFILFQEVPVIVTASKKEEKAVDAPATVYVVSKNDILLRGYSTIKDVLKDLPGMETVEYYFSEVGTLVPVRGVVGNNKIVLLVNGMRVNPPGGEDLMIRSDISVKLAEQIEVIYGPGSTLYGQDAISAVINIITKKPGDEGFFNISAAYGTEDYKEGYLDLGQKIGGVNVSAFASCVDSELIDFSDDYENYWANYRSVAEATGVNTTPARWDEGVNAMIRIATENNSMQVWYRESNRSSSEGSYIPILQFVDEAVWLDSSLVMELQNKASFSEKINLESSLVFNRYEVDPETRYVWPSSGTTLFYNDYKYALGKGVTLEEKISIDVSEKLALLAGVSVSYYDIVPKCTIPGGADVDKDITSQGGSFTYYTQPGNPASRVDIPACNNLVYENYGAYLEGTIRFTDAFKTILGARVDSNSRFDDAPFSPRLAAIYTINENMTIKYIFTKAFVSPPPYFGFNVYDNGAAINTTNPDLEPEEAQSHELNLSISGESLSLNISAYVSEQDNLLIQGDRQLPVNIVRDIIYTDLAGISTRVLTQSANSGESESKGIDVFGRFGIGKASLWASYSYVDYEATIGGVKTGLSFISENNFCLGVTYSVLENLWLTTSLVYRSEPEYDGPTYGLEDELENPYEVNAHILFKPVDVLNVFAHFQNITNNKYALAGMLGPTPQETFKAYLGVRYTR